ncbi:MAG: periplasmic heavy metal sensor [Elusimicrobia bacterium]|nr:periplasmic heavy metal sensor [Elusimicrobiota bacterium]
MIKKFGSVMLTMMVMGSLAAAEKYGYGSPRDEEGMRDRMKSELNLSKEQQKKLETHRIDQRAEMEKLMLDVREKREELKAALENTEMDKRAVGRINEQLKNAQNEMADKRLEGILYVREVLTPDQFKKFLALRPEHSKGNGKGYGPKDHPKNKKDKSRSPSNNKYSDSDEPTDEDPLETTKER